MEIKLIYKLKTLSIKQKLMLIMMVTSSITIILMSLLVVVNQAFNNQRTIQQQLMTLADVLGKRSTGALTFDDAATGIEILNGLSLKPNVIYAVIMQANGKLFAAFDRRDKADRTQKFDLLENPDHSASLWSDLFLNKIHVTSDIYLDNDLIGKIHIISTLDNLYDDLLNFIFLLAIISVICFVATLLICTRLQKLVSDPILNLQKAMISVSEHKDYSLRVENHEENELGILVDGFNHMLEQIQTRDTKLSEYSSHLEKIITKRTQQLNISNTKRILWLETMASFLKHELKNSSVGIKTSLDLIERRSTEKKKVDTYIARARKSMNTMNALLQSVGDANNLEASLYKEGLIPLDLGATVINQMEMYASIYPTLSILADCKPQLIIQGHELYLIQLLDKLISNAASHCDGSTPIKVLVLKQGENALLSVTNNGCSLPKDKQVIFDLFTSFRSSEKKSDDNFGLGLYIVKLIVESHGGHVSARDINCGTGAIFEILLPLIKSD